MKRYLKICGMLLAIAGVMLLWPSEQAEAKQKEKYETIVLQKGESYSLKSFLKMFEDEYATTERIRVGSLRSKIKKGAKVTLSGKGLTVNKNTFKADKTGMYKLKINVKKTTHVFPIHVVKDFLDAWPDEEDWAKCNSITIAKGESYTLVNFLKPYTHYSKDSELGIVRSQIKKGGKFALAGDGLTLKKKSFKAEKTGEYTLRIITRKACYTFPLVVEEKTFNDMIQPSEVAKIHISVRRMGDTFETDVMDANIINQIVGKMLQAQYTYTFPESTGKPVGFAGYSVSLYAADGRCIVSVGLVDTGFRSNNGFWRGKAPFVSECYEYIRQIFHQQVPGDIEPMC